MSTGAIKKWSWDSVYDRSVHSMFALGLFIARLRVLPGTCCGLEWLLRAEGTRTDEAGSCLVRTQNRHDAETIASAASQCCRAEMTILCYCWQCCCPHLAGCNCAIT